MSAFDLSDEARRDADLAAMKARAERAERELSVRSHERNESMRVIAEIGHDLGFPPGVSLRSTAVGVLHVVPDLVAKVAALEARLAEQAPVVEAAERQAKARPGSGPWLTPEERGHRDPDHLAMLAEKYP